MSMSLCGLDCNSCEMKDTCAGCAATNGRPFGGKCMLASCSRQRKLLSCGQCKDVCALKKQLIAEFNQLHIADMDPVTDLNALTGSFINLEYSLPSGQRVKLFDDNRIYLGNQMAKKGSERCYGLIADENVLVVCEYGENGTNSEIVIYQKRGIPRD